MAGDRERQGAAESNVEPRTQRPKQLVDGIILLDKPIGLSSNQALQRVRRLFRAAKAGHGGSLDPLATGMLPICLGQATKVLAFLLDADKAYRFQLAFGARTTTGDTEGGVVETGPKRVDRVLLDQAMASFRGDVRQVPPMYSALKHKGRRLYDLARAGQEVARTPRVVRIHELAVVGDDPERPVFEVRCSKGTYVRSLAEDIARAAGTVGYVAELRRLSVGPFPEQGMVSLATLEAAAAESEEALRRRLLPPDAALVQLPALPLTADGARRIRHGQRLQGNAHPGMPPGHVRLYDPEARFLGVGERRPDGFVVALRLIAGPEPAAANGSGL